MINIDECIKQALKSKNKIELKVYRGLKSKILEFKTAKNAKLYTDEEELKLISKECKIREDAILEFLKADRQDLVSEYRDELEVLQKLLPAPISKSEIYSELSYWAEQNYYVNDEIAYEIEIPKKEMGNVIKYLKSKFPTADGKLISDVVKENLTC